MKVAVHTFSLADDGNIDLRWARERLIPTELERASAFKFDLHRDRYVRCRAMVREILGVGDLPFDLGKNEKPSIPAIEFNVSHSEDRAVLAVAKQPIGIDVECFERKIDFAGLGARCFRPNEQAWVAANPFPEEAFFWTWTAKEARMKLTGEGFSLDPKKIEITYENARPSGCAEPKIPLVKLTPIQIPRVAAACCLATTTSEVEVDLMVR